MAKKFTETFIKKALAKKHYKDFFITGIKNGPTFGATNLRIMDALAVKKSWTNKLFIGYEIKCSRADFLNDAKWTEYLPMCNSFYWACPKGLIKKNEIDKKTGLIYINEYGNCYTVKRPVYRNIKIPDNMLMYIFMNKIQADRYPFHSNKEDFFKDWVRVKKERQSLGREVSLINNIKTLTSELNKINKKNKDIDIILKRYGIENHWQLQEKLQEKH